VTRTRQQNLLIDAYDTDSWRNAVANLTLPSLDRSTRRTQETKERWVFRKLLESSHLDPKRFPVQLIHRDRPDFLMKQLDYCVGIEICECTFQANEDAKNFAHSLNLECYFPPKIPSDQRHYNRRLVERSDKTQYDARRRLTNLSDGYDGLEPENLLCRLLEDIIRKKIGKFNQEDFQKFDRNILAIYNNTSAPNPDLAIVKANLEKVLQGMQKIKLEILILGSETIKLAI